MLTGGQKTLLLQLKRRAGGKLSDQDVRLVLQRPIDEAVSEGCERSGILGRRPRTGDHQPLKCMQSVERQPRVRKRSAGTRIGEIQERSKHIRSAERAQSQNCVSRLPANRRGRSPQTGVDVASDRLLYRSGRR